MMSASRSRRQVVVWSPPLSLALRVSCQYLNVLVWLSQGVAKPSSSSTRNVYLYMNFVRAIPEILVANFVHPLYSHKISASTDQHGTVHSPCFASYSYMTPNTSTDQHDKISLVASAL